MTDDDKTNPRRAPRAVPIGERTEERASAATPEAPERVRAPRVVSGTVSLTEIEDDPFLREALELPPAEPKPRRGLTAGKIFAAGLGLLVSLAVGVWIDSLIRALFERLPWLGWLALGIAIAAALALLALIWREVRGLMRLEKVADLRTDIETAETPLLARHARQLADRVSAFLGNRPQTAKGRAALTELEKEVVDGPQLIRFAERELLGTLDREARALIVSSARRVALVTAVSPRASVDMLYVGWEAVRLVRAMAILYGGRPGAIGLMRLFRDVVAHLAVTGTVAAGDSIIQQAVGHGVAARISTRLGEGVINGLMTARIGVSAMDLCRPMPFAALARPRVSEFFTDLTDLIAKKTEERSKP